MTKGTREECWPHRYVGGWTKEDDGDGVIFCAKCGDIKALTVPVPSIPLEDREDWPKMAGLFRGEAASDE